MERPNVQRQEIKIGSSTILAFRQGFNDYFLNLSQVGRLIGKPTSSPSEFLETKAFKTKHGKGFRPSEFSDENNIEYKCLPLDVVKGYLSYWAKRGNEAAWGIIDALTEESLTLRCQVAFQENSQESSKETQETSNAYLAQWREIREHCRHAQNSFTKAGFNAIAHDYLTTKLWGMTAKEAKRLLDLVEGDPQVGINHQGDQELLTKLAKVKLEAASYWIGTWQQKIDRAIAKYA